MVIEDENLRKFVILSTVLHVVTMLVLYFGIPSFFTPPPPDAWTPVPVDIVEIGEITNTRLRTEEEPKEEPPAPKPKPAPEEKQSQPEPAKPEPPKPAQEPKAETVPEPDELSIAKPKEKPKPIKEKPPEPQADPLASVLKNVAKLKPTPPAPQNKTTEETKESQPTSAPVQAGPALADRLTISQEDALRRQISSCWNMPVGAKNAHELIVEVLIEVNEDRTVRSAEVVDRMRLNTDSHFRAAAEAAIRALRHPKCTPLELPPDQYEQWKTIRFNFDPRDML